MELSRALDFYLKANGNWSIAGQAAREAGVYRQKAGAGGSRLDDLNGDFQSLVGSTFLESMASGPSAFDRIKPFTRPGAFNIPFLTPAAPLSAAVVAEGKHLPVSKLSNNSAALTPVKVGGLAVASKEALSTPEGMAAFVAELRVAVGVATDDSFLTGVQTDADTSQAATSDPLADIQVLFDGVNLSGFGSLYFVCPPSVANRMATLRAGTGEGFLFPRATPTGGDILGVPLLVTAGAPAGTLTLIDATALCTGSEDMTIKLSDSAMVEMDSAPAGETTTPSGASGALVSVFQADAVALLGIRSFAAKLVRTSGAAVLTGCTDSTGWA